MQKEEWEQVKEALGSMYKKVQLEIDGYNITLQLQRISTYKNAIVIYVNGEIKIEWLSKDKENEIRKRFIRVSERSLIKAKDKKNMPKRLLKEYDMTYKTYLPYWVSFGGLKRHLIKNNERIELIGII